MDASRLAEQILEDANGVETSQYREVAQELLARGDSAEVLAYLLKSHYGRAQQKAAAPAESPKGDRQESTRPPREKKPKQEAPEDSPFSNLYVSLGRDNGLNELTDLMNALAELAEVDPATSLGLVT